MNTQIDDMVAEILARGGREYKVYGEHDAPRQRGFSMPPVDGIDPIKCDLNNDKTVIPFITVTYPHKYNENAATPGGASMRVFGNKHGEQFNCTAGLPSMDNYEKLALRLLAAWNLYAAE
jgi:hypothetical protein